MPGALKLLAAEQRGIKMVKKFFTRRKRRGINPNTSTPVGLSKKYQNRLFSRKGRNDFAKSA
jgi:hypothetical protein